MDGKISAICLWFRRVYSRLLRLHRASGSLLLGVIAGVMTRWKGVIQVLPLK